MKHVNWQVLSLLASTALVAAEGAWAAEGFQVRYNLAGTLGAEMFSPIDQQGWAGSIVRSDARADKVTGPDGGPLKVMLPPGTTPVSYGPSLATVASSGRLVQYNAVIAYITPERFGDGRLGLAVNLPHVSRKTQTTSITAATPTVAPLAQDSFNTFYQGGLAARSAADSGEVDGVGDVELQAGWLHRDERLRVLVGASLVIPTGSNNPAMFSGPDVSLGKFYTLRPAAQVVYQPQPDLSVGGKVTYGVSSRNQDSDLRSGNWISLEGASGWRTSYGIVGLHTVFVRQVQDDSGGPWGSNRIRSDNFGVFYMNRIPALDAGFHAQYMKTTKSRNAKHGDYLQLRLSKAF